MTRSLDDEAAEIARGLTKAQRAELFVTDWWAPEPATSRATFADQGGYREPERPQVAAALLRLGLLERAELAETERCRGTSTSDRRRYHFIYRGTPLGLAVRAHLQSESNKA